MPRNFLLQFFTEPFSEVEGVTSLGMVGVTYNYS